MDRRDWRLTRLAAGSSARQAPINPGTGDLTTRGVIDTRAVTVFVRNGATWAIRSDLKALRIGASDQFCLAVALSGDGTLLTVGAQLEKLASPNGEPSMRRIPRPQARGEVGAFL